MQHRWLARSRNPTSDAGRATNKVVHSWPFSSIFSSFLFLFSISFSKNGLQNETRMALKMIIFQPILIPILLTRFQAPPQNLFTFSQSLCNLSTCSLWHQKQRRVWVQLPNLSLHQPPNKSKSLLQRLQNLFSLTPLTNLKRMPPHSPQAPHQLRPAAWCAFRVLSIENEVYPWTWAKRGKMFALTLRQMPNNWSFDAYVFCCFVYVCM